MLNRVGCAGEIHISLQGSWINLICNRYLVITMGIVIEQCEAVNNTKWSQQLRKTDF